MRLIEAALSDPSSSGIVICGAAGVGKSRIAREALESAASRGCVTHWAVGTSCARTLPLGAFTTWAPSDGTDTVQLVRGVIESLTAAAPGATVVGVDDVHLLDDLSTFVVHQIVQRAAAKVVLTVRDGEPIPAGTQELWKAGQFDRLDLQPLSADETTTLLSATLGGSMDSHAASRLWELTRGNALYLRHIVEQEIADGRLKKLHGYWQWIGDPVMPCGLVELIESRIGALPADGRRRHRRARHRRADRADSAATDRRSRRRRGSRHPWPDHPRPRRQRHRSPAGASALRRGAQETRGTHQAAAAARTGRRRTGRWRRPRRHASRDPPRHIEPRLRPPARCRPALQCRPRRDLARGSVPRRSARGSGRACRSRTRSPISARARIVVARPRQRSRSSARRPSRSPN